MVHPLVHKHFVDARTLHGVIIKYFSDQIASCIRNLNILWEIVGIHPDALVGSLNIRRLKWRFADNKCVDYDTK